MDQVNGALEYFHSDHSRRMKEPEFARQEVMYFEKRLEDLVNRITNRPILQELEQFQNRFIREREVMDDLRHRVKKEEYKLVQALKADKLSMEQFDLGSHLALGRNMVDFARLNSELRHAFNTFLLRQFQAVTAV
jgi:hypothetical protein